MVTFNLPELDKLERRERQLTVLAAVVVLVMAAGMALLMYPLVFVRPVQAEKLPLRFAFFGFCVLSLLISAYLLDRQRTFRNVKQQLVSQLQKNAELQDRGNTDLLHTIPDLNHFQDRLAMDFRRAATMQRTLSVLVVKIVSLRNSSDANKDTAALGDAARAIARIMRPSSDSMYRLEPGLFGLILSDTDTATAKRLKGALEESLRLVGANNNFSFATFVSNYPDHAKSAHDLEEAVFSRLSAQQPWVEATEAGAS
jgi:GGDEF domain-containing protein